MTASDFQTPRADETPAYDPTAVERKWQALWEERGTNSYTEAHRLTGDNEWTQVALPLTQGQREVLVQFGLTTDGSIVKA